MNASLRARTRHRIEMVSQGRSSVREWKTFHVEAQIEDPPDSLLDVRAGSKPIALSFSEDDLDVGVLLTRKPSHKTPESVDRCIQGQPITLNLKQAPWKRSPPPPPPFLLPSLFDQPLLAFVRPDRCVCLTHMNPICQELCS